MRDKNNWIIIGVYTWFGDCPKLVFEIRETCLHDRGRFGISSKGCNFEIAGTVVIVGNEKSKETERKRVRAVRLNNRVNHPYPIIHNIVTTRFQISLRNTVNCIKCASIRIQSTCTNHPAFCAIYRYKRNCAIQVLPNYKQTPVETEA